MGKKKPDCSFSALVLIFVYQQGVILKRIDVLSRQTIVTDKGNVSGTSR